MGQNRVKIVKNRKKVSDMSAERKPSHVNKNGEKTPNTKKTDEIVLNCTKSTKDGQKFRKTK